MEELEDADSRRNSRIATASNSQSSCHVRETNVESKETRHQEGTKALSSETLKNLCRALNDPNVSVDVKKRIGLLLRQLHQRYLERSHTPEETSSDASSYVRGTESFQAAVASGVVSHFEQQRNFVKASEPLNVYNTQPNLLKTSFSVRREEEVPVTPLSSSEVSKTVNLERTKRPNETSSLPKAYSSFRSDLSNVSYPDFMIPKYPKTRTSDLTSSSSIERRECNSSQVSMPIHNSGFLSGPKCIPPSLTENSVGIESNFASPVYQKLKGTLYGEEHRSSHPVSSSYSNYNGKRLQEPEENYLKQSILSNKSKALSADERKNLTCVSNYRVGTSASIKFGSSSVRQDYPLQSSSLSSFQERKRLRLLSAPQRDLEAIQHPNYQTRFTCLEDAYRRLIPYHLLYFSEDGLESERRQEWEASFDKVYAKLKQNTYQEEDRWKRVGHIFEAEPQLDDKAATQQVIETSVFDEILASSFLLKDT